MPKNKNKHPKKKKVVQIKKPSQYYATVVSGAPFPSRAEESNQNKIPINNSPTKLEPHLNLSRFFGYSIAKNLDGGFELAKGTTGLWGQRTEKGFGICLEKNYRIPPEVKTRQEFENFISQKPNFFALSDGYTRRWSVYERLNNVDEVVAVLQKNKTAKAEDLHFVSLSFQMFPSIETASMGYVQMPKPDEKPLANHSVSSLTYIESGKYIFFQSGWGKEWGDSGDGYLPYRYLERYFVEAWVSIGYTHSMIGTKWVKEPVTHKNKNGVDFEVFTTPSLINRPKTWVVDAYADSGRIIGWAHFRIYPNGCVEMEELFGIPEFGGYPIMTTLLEIIIEQAKANGANKVNYYVHVQDVVTEERLRAMRQLFQSAGWKIFDDTRRFAGCYWRVEKILF